MQVSDHPVHLFLRDEFVSDHKVMSRGYRDILRSLSDGLWEEASQLAAELDRACGPHIEFEELYLYAAVRRFRGDAHINEMYEEHERIREGLVSLSNWPSDQTPDDAQVLSWKNAIRLGADHAVVCGELLNYLEALDLDEQQTLLEALQRLRAKGRAWSDLP